MIWEISLRQAGDSVTATLPQEMLDCLQVKPGDRLFATETADGILLRSGAPDHRKAIEAFDEVRRQYRRTLRQLAE